MITTTCVLRLSTISVGFLITTACASRLVFVAATVDLGGVTGGSLRLSGSIGGVEIGGRGSAFGKSVVMPAGDDAAVTAAGRAAGVGAIVFAGDA